MKYDYIQWLNWWNSMSTFFDEFKIYVELLRLVNYARITLRVTITLVWYKIDIIIFIILHNVVGLSLSWVPAIPMHLTVDNVDTNIIIERIRQRYT